ncbi:MAG: WcaF family extracellular polysaccharide biosynthesis acetyltransferase [Pseudomonadota bacterium]
MAAPSLDISANRSAIKWSNKALVGRVLWAMAHPFFAWTPRPLWVWRRALLRLFGASIGDLVQIYPSVRITIPWNLSIGKDSSVGDRATLYALGPISIGRAVTISQNSHLCAGSHDYRRSDMKLIKPPITIGDGAWICADAFIGPGVDIGEHAIVGARAVVTTSVDARMIVAGNPANVIRERDEPSAES